MQRRCIESTMQPAMSLIQIGNTRDIPEYAVYEMRIGCVIEIG